MKYIIMFFSIVALFSLVCALAVADNGLTNQQQQLLETGCSYITIDIDRTCVHELT